MPVLNRSLKSYVNNTDEFIWCKGLGCHYLIPVNTNCSPITCPKCEIVRCGGCGEDVHDGKTCEEVDLVNFSIK
jgi:hypothetical protein